MPNYKVRVYATFCLPVEVKAQDEITAVEQAETEFVRQALIGIPAGLEYADEINTSLIDDGEEVRPPDASA